MILVESKLWDAVEESESEGYKTLAEEKKKEKQLQCLAKISLCLAKNQLGLITKAETGKEAWKILKDRYEQPSLANKLFLRKKFFKAQMLDVLDYLARDD